MSLLLLSTTRRICVQWALSVKRINTHWINKKGNIIPLMK